MKLAFGNARISRRRLLAGCLAWTCGGTLALAADNGQASQPPLGWSSWSALETNIDENTVRAIAQIQASVLKPSGYVYVNVDGGWYLNPDLGVDAYGRWIPDPAKFPGGMRALADYIHRLGLKFGLYVTPGIPKLAVNENSPVENSTHHASDIAETSRTETTYLGGTMYSIDFTRPGAQEFVNSWANLFAEWGVDYLKLDAITASNVPDVKAWSAALLQTGRPIHLALANNLDPDYAATWRQYSNGWRISTDIESYNGLTLTSWEQVALRFALEPKWLGAAGRGGWNDLDSIEVGGPHDGLSLDERQSMMAFWALSASPLIVGDDLRDLDARGIQLLTNREVLEINQNGVVASPSNWSAAQQIWSALQPDGSFAVGLFNLAGEPATLQANWATIGFTGYARVRDVWRAVDLGPFEDSFTASLPPHGVQLLRVFPRAAVFRYLAGKATVTGGAWVGASTVGAGGQRVHSVGAGGVATFPNVNVTRAGLYDLTINYVNGDAAPRVAILAVNGSNAGPLNFPAAGDWAANVTQQGLTTAVELSCGANTLQFVNPSGAAPDIIGFTLQLRRPNAIRVARASCNATAGSVK